MRSMADDSRLPVSMRRVPTWQPVGVLLLLFILVGATIFLLTAAPTPAHALQQPHGPLTNRIITENAQPGTDEWANIGNYDINNLAAYPGATSVNAGNPIAIYVKSSGTSLSARLYRLGY